MGGEQFETLKWLKDPKAAFNSAKQQALWDYGHSGYSGTIAEKPGFAIRKQNPMTQEEASAFIFGGRLGNKDIKGDIEDNDKWGDAFAVPICKEPGGGIDGWLFYGWASS